MHHRNRLRVATDAALGIYTVTCLRLVPDRDRDGDGDSRLRTQVQVVLVIMMSRCRHSLGLWPCLFCDDNFHSCLRPRPGLWLGPLARGRPGPPAAVTGVCTQAELEHNGPGAGGTEPPGPQRRSTGRCDSEPWGGIAMRRSPSHKLTTARRRDGRNFLV